MLGRATASGYLALQALHAAADLRGGQMYLLPNLLVGSVRITLQCSKKTDIKAIQH